MLSLPSRPRLARFFQRNPYLHLYSLGDLDDFFWPHATYYGLEEGGELRAVALLYRGGGMPVLLALTDDLPPMEALLRQLLPELPARFYAHLTPGLEPVFRDAFALDSHGDHYKMALRDPARVWAVDAADAVPLTPADRARVEALYAESYPGNFFDPRMLETGTYFGLERDGRLVSVAGVHVCSPRYRVAALGNVATHPAYRGRGCGTRVTARVCQALLEARIERIGLNVKADNAPALTLYRRLGFQIVARYREFTVRSQRPGAATSRG